MAEKNLAHCFRDHMRKHGHVQRIENAVGTGMCDVNICIAGTESWVELKQLDNWPVKADTLVLVPHYTPQQRNWQRARAQAGGRVYVLLQVDTFYLLLPWYAAVSQLGKCTRDVLLANALLHAVGRFPEAELLTEFTSITPYKSMT
jgi:hypothetical protein